MGIVVYFGLGFRVYSLLWVRNAGFRSSAVVSYEEPLNPKTLVSVT